QQIMTPDGCAYHPDLFSGYAGHSSHRLTQIKFLSASDGDRFVRHSPINHGRSQNDNQIFDSQRTNGLLLKAHHDKKWKGIQRMAQVVQHVIATAINHSRPDNSVIKTRSAHYFFGSPLRFMIGRATIGTRAQKTHQHDLLYSGRSRGHNDISCSVNMNSLVSLLADLTIDSGAMCDCVAAGEG